MAKRILFECTATITSKAGAESELGYFAFSKCGRHGDWAGVLSATLAATIVQQQAQCVSQ